MSSQKTERKKAKNTDSMYNVLMSKTQIFIPSYHNLFLQQLSFTLFFNGSGSLNKNLFVNKRNIVHKSVSQHFIIVITFMTFISVTEKYNKYIYIFFSMDKIIK